MGKYEVAVKVVSLLKDLARHLIVAEKLGVTANFKILLGAVAAKSTREEDTTIIEEIITTLRLFATTLPSTIEVQALFLEPTFPGYDRVWPCNEGLRLTTSKNYFTRAKDSCNTPY